MGNGYATEMTYDFNTIGGAVAAINGFVGQMQTDLDDVKSKVLNGLSTWQGATQAVFQPYFDKWDGGARELATVLTTWATKTDQAAQQMGGTDQRLSNTLFQG